uniref:Calponin-homology (CH) domain-containing protein n=1 Tax=Cyclopterus lumpus TaxID=8103 RepID=A0A8C2XN01_CYCLU
ITVPETFTHTFVICEVLRTAPHSDSVSGQAGCSPDRDTPTNHGAPEFPAANSEEGLYYQNVLTAVERWFSHFGWPSGPHPISVPHTLRRYTQQLSSGATIDGKGHNYCIVVSRSVVDMLRHLTGKQIPGIPQSQAFSTDIDQRTDQLLQQHEAMLAFLSRVVLKIHPILIHPHIKDGSVFAQVLVLSRVSESGLNNATLKSGVVDGVPSVGSQPQASNVYSSCELRLLLWLNVHYQSMRKTVVPSARWIVNFDLDLTDGLVLAALLAAYCPYLICSHFQRMYSTTGSLEQILHNNIIVAQALTVLYHQLNQKKEIKISLTSVSCNRVTINQPD